MTALRFESLHSFVFLIVFIVLFVYPSNATIIQPSGRQLEQPARGCRIVDRNKGVKMLCPQSTSCEYSCGRRSFKAYWFTLRCGAGAKRSVELTGAHIEGTMHGVKGVLCETNQKSELLSDTILDGIRSFDIKDYKVKDHSHTDRRHLLAAEALTLFVFRLRAAVGLIANINAARGLPRDQKCAH